MLRKFPALPMNMVTRLRFDKRNTAVGQRAWSKVRFPPITDSLAPKSALSPVVVRQTSPIFALQKRRVGKRRGAEDPKD